MKRLLLLSVLVALAAGCSNEPPPPLRPHNDPYGASQVHVESEDLRDRTAVSQPIATRDENNILFVSIPIRATGGQTLYVEYDAIFYDGNHQQLSKLGPFQKTLRPNSPDQININSLSPRADDFTVSIRYAR